MRGRFLMGVMHDGVLHYNFSVKLLSLGGECEALDLIDDLNLPDEDNRNRAENMLAELCFLAQQIEIDGINRDVLTPQFLLDNLSPDDYVLAWGLLGDLRKKQIDAGANQSTDQ